MLYISITIYLYKCVKKYIFTCGTHVDLQKELDGNYFNLQVQCFATNFSNQQLCNIV